MRRSLTRLYHLRCQVNPTASLSTSSVRSYSTGAGSTTNPTSGNNNSQANATIPAEEILVKKIGTYSEITLNRPKALNALNLNMVRALKPIYQNLMQDSSTSFIVLRGSGEKAFCAGGDVRSIYDSVIKQQSSSSSSSSNDSSNSTTPLSRTFFEEEYQLDLLISRLPKPQIAVLSGIVMGGGVGLSIFSRYRIAFPDSLFAMPETGIGFFPDVGASFFLSRMRHGFEYGMYLAMTGQKLSGLDLWKTGIATHYMTKPKFTELQAVLPKLKGTQELERTLNSYSEHHVKVNSAGQMEDMPAEAKTLPHLSSITRVFGQPTLKQIYGELDTLAQREGEEGKWAKDTLKVLKNVSQNSLRVVLDQMREGRKTSLEDCFKMDLRISQRMVHENDFKEGIRALLVDKTKDPKWKPQTYDKVVDADVLKYFSPLDKELDTYLFK